MTTNNLIPDAQIGTPFYYPLKPSDRSEPVKTRIHSEPLVFCNGAIVAANSLRAGVVSIEYIVFEPRADESGEVKG